MKVQDYCLEIDMFCLAPTKSIISIYFNLKMIQINISHIFFVNF